MGFAALPVTNEVTCLDGEFRVANIGGRLTAQDIDAFVLVMMDVMFGGLVSRLDFNDVKPDSGQTGKVDE